MSHTLDLRDDFKLVANTEVGETADPEHAHATGFQGFSRAFATSSDRPEKILEIGPQHVIGFCTETVVGATSGAVPPTPGYFKGVREICDRYGVLYIADEVMCGMGRTGTLYSVEQDGVVPDLLAIAKGLGGGYQPMPRRKGEDG